MTMMAGHFTGQMPFRDVYIHGLVLDENGKKMSKTANNGINPLLLIKSTELTPCATLKKSLVPVKISGYNRKTDESASVEASRNFANSCGTLPDL